MTKQTASARLFTKVNYGYMYDSGY